MSVMRCISCFLRKTLETSYCLIRFACRESFRNSIKKDTDFSVKKSDSITLFATGPSLKQTLLEFPEKSTLKSDLGCVNYFANDPLYTVLKPEYYYLSDPMFFTKDTVYYEKAKALLIHLNESTTWKMNLYLPYNSKRSGWDIRKILTNPNIRIAYFYYSSFHKGFDCIRNLFYSMGLGNGEFGTVILNGIYIAIQCGYKHIYLYGADHNFFDNLYVDENNCLLCKYTHFDDKETVKLKPFPVPGKCCNYDVEHYLKDHTHPFTGHNFMRKYADYKGVEIINCTANSLIDSYVRKIVDNS